MKLKSILTKNKLIKLKNSFNFSRTKNFGSYKFSSSVDQNQTMTDTDVIIIGGGIPGLSLAAAFLESDITTKIVVIDQQEDLIESDYKYSPNRIPDSRAVSLTPGSMNFLEAIDLLPYIDKRILTFVKELQIWENYGSSFVNIRSDHHKSVVDSLKNLGLFSEKIINNVSEFFNIDKNNSSKQTNKGFFDTHDPNLNDSLKEMKYISCMAEINTILMALQRKLENKYVKYKERLTKDNFKVEQSEDYAYFTHYKGDQSMNLRSKLIVVCDGAKSIVRSKLDIPLSGFKYNETGLVCTLKAYENSKTAYQRFLQNGIFALLPMYDNYFSIVSSMPTEFNEKLLELSENDFVNYVNQILHKPGEYELSNLEKLVLSNNNNYNRPPIIQSVESKRQTFPLNLQIIDNFVYNNIVFIGDSAHSVHPMAGQGLNLGIADVAILSEYISQGTKIGKRINDKSILQNFNLKSSLNVKLMIAAMEGVKTMFSHKDDIISKARNLGMFLVNNNEYLKGGFVDFASGNLILPSKYNWQKKH